MPELNAVNLIGLLSRLAHIFSAVVLAGGLVYMRMMVVPPRERATVAGDSADRYFFGLRSRWAVCVMICATLLLASGFYNYIMKVRAEKFDMAYHALFGAKLLLGLFVIFAASVVGGRSAAAQKARDRMRAWLNLAIAVAVVVILIGNTMRTFRGVPKVEDETATATRATFVTASTERG